MEILWAGLKKIYETLMENRSLSKYLVNEKISESTPRIFHDGMVKILIEAVMIVDTAVHDLF